MAQFYARWVPPKPSIANTDTAKILEVAKDTPDTRSLEHTRKQSKKDSRKHHHKATRLEQPARNSSAQKEDSLNGKDSEVGQDLGKRQSTRKSQSREESKRSKKRKRDVDDSDNGVNQTKDLSHSKNNLAPISSESHASNEKPRHKSKKSKHSKRQSREAEEFVVPVNQEETLKHSNVSQRSKETKSTKESTKHHRHKDREGQATNVSKSAPITYNHTKPGDSQEAPKAVLDESFSDNRHENILAKFQKSIARQAHEITPEEASGATADNKNDGEVELHGLEPLPQPEPIAEPEYKPTFSALPSWISNPITVPHSARKSFAEMSLDEKTVQSLSQRGFTEALAIQSAVIPMLLGPAHMRHSDICVAATTGSGKTLAYTLPIVEALKSRTTTKLRAVVILPTRELVSQVSKVVGQQSSGTSLKMGTAVGAVPLSHEQEVLIEKGRQYDPEGRKILEDKAHRRIIYGDVDVKEDLRVLEDGVRMLSDHVPVYNSGVDILICTPGRLVDHIQSTIGFSLDDLEWLIVDEADRLLDEDFQQWVDILMGTLEKSKPLARDQLIAELCLPPERRSIQKVVLSATMTKDISKLSSLKLRRPKMVVMEDVETSNVSDGSGRITGGQGSELPATLKEFAVPVGDGLEKPLYLLRFLRDHAFAAEKDEEIGVEEFADPAEKDACSISADEDDSLSASGRSSSESSAPAEEPYVELIDRGLVPADDVGVNPFSAASPTPLPRTQEHTDIIRSNTAANVLIFTNSNENATRLSHLIGILHPPYARLAKVLTKSATSSAGKKILASFQSGKSSILIASDRASRGLDFPQLSHVVNYDIPRSVTSYIHRVGRTARAGRAGSAWTFFTSTEARWFWNAIARANDIVRHRPVERKRLDTVGSSDREKQEYEEALSALKRAVRGDED